jgi:hypothetical protein
MMIKKPQPPAFSRKPSLLSSKAKFRKKSAVVITTLDAAAQISSKKKASKQVPPFIGYSVLPY